MKYPVPQKQYHKTKNTDNFAESKEANYNKKQHQTIAQTYRAHREQAKPYGHKI